MKWKLWFVNCRYDVYSMYLSLGDFLQGLTGLDIPPRATLAVPRFIILPQVKPICQELIRGILLIASFRLFVDGCDRDAFGDLELLSK